MTLLVMKRSRFLFFVCLLLILIPLLQAAAGPRLVAENLDRVNVTVNANLIEIGVYSNVSLASGGVTTLALVWNTTSFPKGNYTVTIHASCVPEETNIVDNTASNWVFVTILGDVDGDFNVDIIDVVKIAVAYGASSEEPRHTLLMDLNCDGRITILDIALCTSHYGETYP